MFLGIDIGTSSVKAVVVNQDNDVIEQSSAPLPISRPHPLWSEQSPADWWEATTKAVQALAPDRRESIVGIGLSGQMHGATLLDEHDKPLRPAILWNDGRSHRECEALEQSEPRSRDITANLAMPGFTAPKLLWVREHEADVFARTKKVLLPKDYVRLLMTGEYASDMSDSAGTLWMNVAERKWSPEMLAASGLDESHMPSLVEGSQVTGKLRADVADSWGVPQAVVVGGGGDNAAGAVGVGVINSGEAFLSLGTSGVIFLAGERCLPDPEQGVHAFCHALPDRWHQMSVMLSAAACVDWAARLTGVGGAGEFVQRAESRGRFDAGEIFLPYLSGERTPHNNPYARGVFFGLDHDSDAGAIAQSVLEGVAFAFAQGLDALIGAGGKVDSITVIGGGARSAYWGRILAAALGRTLVYRRDGDVGPAYGAAKLARIGLTGEAPETVCAAPPVMNVVEPEAELMDQFAPKKERFAAIYSQLKNVFPTGD